MLVPRQLALRVLFLSLASLFTQPSHAIDSAVAVSDLDPAAFVQWFDGREQPLDIKEGPRHVIWTKDSAVQWNGVYFGDSKVAGPRHLRIGFQSPMHIGSVLVRAGGQLSVLKPNAAYPGNLSDESQWIAAERLQQRAVTNAAVEGEEYAVWVLPPQTQSRALRFTHVAAQADKSYAGWLGGVYVLSDRLANVAAQAFAATAQNPQKAQLLNNESNDRTWSAWENMAARGQDDAPLPELIAKQPAELLLIWPQPVALRGLNALWAGFAAAEVQAFVGPTDRHPREATAADWQAVKAFDGIDCQYPRALGVNWLDFDRPVTTRAIRVRLTKVAKEDHPHLQGNTRDGRRVWLGELLALRSLGDAPLASVILPAAADEQSHPPIPVRFTLSQPGLVTLVIEDTDGKRVRNLVSETPFPAGENVAWWDGLDDLGRDTEAARHGVYHVPGQFVRPGTYRVRGLFHAGLDLRYEFPIYTAGSPAWNTADNTGAWLSNHTPPSSALFVPGDRTPGGQPLVYLGSFVSEGTHGLAWVNLEGRKVGGVNWVGGNWTGAPLLARDDGAQRIADVIAYAGSIWEADKAKRQVEVRLTALTGRGDRPVIKHVYALGDEASGRDRQLDAESEMGGLAARNGFLFMALRRQGKVLVVDARQTTANSPGNQTSGKVAGSIATAEPRGLAFDGEGAAAHPVRQAVGAATTAAGSIEDRRTAYAAGARRDGAGGPATRDSGRTGPGVRLRLGRQPPSEGLLGGRQVGACDRPSGIAASRPLRSAAHAPSARPDARRARAIVGRRVRRPAEARQCVVARRTIGDGLLRAGRVRRRRHAGSAGQVAVLLPRPAVQTGLGTRHRPLGSHLLPARSRHAGVAPALRLPGAANLRARPEVLFQQLQQQPDQRRGGCDCLAFARGRRRCRGRVGSRQQLGVAEE